MFVLMRFGSYLKNGHPIWHYKICPWKPPISPFETPEKPPLMFEKVGKHANVSFKLRIFGGIKL